MITKRVELVRQVETSLKRNPGTAILGPRQCGKMTLAKEVGLRENAAYFDLEDPRDQARLSNPQLALESLHGVVILVNAHRGSGFEAGKVVGDLSRLKRLPNG